VKLDDQVITDPTLVIQGPNNPVKVSLGKKRHGLLIR
jgi:hypothetical protein